MLRNIAVIDKLCSINVSVDAIRIASVRSYKNINLELI